MNTAGDQFLTATALSPDQNTGVSLGDQGQAFTQINDTGSLTDQLLFFSQLGPQGAVLMAGLGESGLQ